jgi:hypothetical protein
MTRRRKGGRTPGRTAGRQATSSSGTRFQYLES